MQGHPKALPLARGEWDLLVALLNLLHSSLTLVEAPCGYGEGLILPLKQGEQDQHILPRTQVDAGGGEPRHGMGSGQRAAGLAQGASRTGGSSLGRRSPPVPWGSPMGDFPLKGAGGTPTPFPQGSQQPRCA